MTDRSVRHVGPRDAIVALLEQETPDDVRVIPVARDVDRPTVDTLMVDLREWRPDPEANVPGAWIGTGALFLLTAARYAGGRADDDLDALLFQVLTVLDTALDRHGITWQLATRGTFADSKGVPRFPCYEVAITVPIESQEATP